jgi:hypothetical protein
VALCSAAHNRTGLYHHPRGGSRGYFGFDRIATRLNEEGIPTRTGRPWHGVVVNRILTRKALGESVFPQY